MQVQLGQAAIGLAANAAHDQCAARATPLLPRCAANPLDEDCEKEGLVVCHQGRIRGERGACHSAAVRLEADHCSFSLTTAGRKCNLLVQLGSCMACLF